MAGSLTTKHKLVLLLLCLLLALTIVARVSYSKHFHGLLCAARTFHEYSFSDTDTTRSIESERDSDSTSEEDVQPKEDVADKIGEIRNRLRQERIQEEETAVRNGIITKKMVRKMAKKKGGRGQKYVQVLPQAIVIGVRKCGTRALLEMLETHPQIAASGPEVHFFDKYYNLGLDWYQKQMKPSTAGQITIEKTPSYYITDKAPERIHSMNKDTKLLVIVRDPTTRVISDYTQIASKGESKLSGTSFEKTVMDGDQVRTSYKAVQISIYAQYLDRWLEFFPLSQMHFVDGDKLIANPLPEMKKVEQFLGLPDFISSDNFYYNATSGFYCLAGDLNSKCLSASKGREHPKVSAEVVQKLQEFFRPYNEKFFRKISHRFDWP